MEKQFHWQSIVQALIGILTCITLFLTAIAIVVVINIASGQINSFGRPNDDMEKHSVSTSIPSMLPLLELEQKLIANLEAYSMELEKKLDIVKSGLAALSIEHNKSKLDPKAYLSNPLNSFSLIRRLHSDWFSWLSFMTAPLGTAQIKFVQNMRNKLPTNFDLKEAGMAMLRLQTIYNLKPLDMAHGLLRDKQYDAHLSAYDTYTVGRILADQRDFYHAGFWLYAAYNTFELTKLNSVFGLDEKRILEFYALCLQEQNRIQEALNVVELILKKYPQFKKFLDLKRELEFHLEKKEQFGLKIEKEKFEWRAFARGCRDEYKKPPSRLHCRYNNTTTPFLHLAPFKMEEVNLDPYIVIYHDIISDDEIDALKEVATPNLGRALVYNEFWNIGVADKSRTSQLFWVNDHLTPMTVRLNQRIADMTGLDLENAENLQVMNYGLGGHYALHYDYFDENSPAVKLFGDRVATLMFYLSDVEQGGATVFPHIKATIFPKKGTAVFWYNLNNRGKRDPRTMHGACPVLVGDKWVVNKWIRDHTQIFQKPCYEE